MTKYLTEKEVSYLTGRAVNTLRNDRSKGIGIPYIKMGTSVRYDPEDIKNYMNSCKVQTINTYH